MMGKLHLQRFSCRHLLSALLGNDVGNEFNGQLCFASIILFGHNGDLQDVNKRRSHTTKPQILWSACLRQLKTGTDDCPQQINQESASMWYDCYSPWHPRLSHLDVGDNNLSKSYRRLKKKKSRVKNDAEHAHKDTWHIAVFIPTLNSMQYPLVFKESNQWQHMLLTAFQGAAHASHACHSYFQR